MFSLDIVVEGPFARIGHMTAPLRVVTSRSLLEGFPADAFADRVDVVSARTDEELRAAVREAQVLFSWVVPDTIPAETPRLRWIQLPSAGADHLHRHPVWKSDLTITTSRGVHTVPIAEHFFALLLALTRGMVQMVRAQERAEWERGSKLHL